jgi:MraZ protein
MPDADSNVPVFQGEFSYGVDESHRVMIPAKWRPKDPKVVFTAILWPIEAEEYLLVLPPERWRALLETFKTRPLSDKKAATLERVIGATSASMVLDKVGRFCLPEHLSGPAGLDKDALFVGRLEKFEIWSPKRYQAATALEKSVAAQYAAELNI